MLQMLVCLGLCLVDGHRGENQSKLAAGASCLTTEFSAAAHPFLSLVLLVLEPMLTPQDHRPQRQSRWKSRLQLESLQCLEQGEGRCLVGLGLPEVGELHPLQTPANRSCFGLSTQTAHTTLHVLTLIVCCCATLEAGVMQWSFGTSGRFPVCNS